MVTFDRSRNPYLIWTYTELTYGEKLSHYHALGDRIAYHKRNYYLGNPEINDCEYDYLECYYEAVAADLRLEPIAINKVGYDLTFPSPGVNLLTKELL